MSDYPSSLPVRTEGDLQEKIQSKLVDYTTPTQGATIDTDGNLHVESHGNKPAGGDVTLRLSELGAPNQDGVYDATDNTKPASVGVVAAVRGATPADADQTQRVTAKTGTVDTTVHAMDVSLHDQNGNGYTASNPVPVVLVDAIAGATEILDYKKASAIIKNSSDTHTYTITAGKTLVLQKIMASASGKIKMEVRLGVIGSEVAKIVMFNSTANPNCEYEFKTPQRMADTDDVLVIVTNLDNGPNDLYSVVEGYEI